MRKEQMDRQISVEEGKRIGLHTLLFFSEFCKEHQLRYQIAYGTLIGAVRHQGFIPWDDDIDVWMPREDYDRLMQLSGEMVNEGYILHTIENNRKFLFAFAKLGRIDTVVLPSRFTNGFVYGTSIDIFPLDYVGKSEDYEECRNEYLQLKNIFEKKIGRYYAYTGGIDESLPKKIAKKILFLIANYRYGTINEQITSYAHALRERYDKQSAYYVTTIAGETIYKKEWFENTVELEFENHMFCAPAAYDKILNHRYGDYRILPPESERVVPHSFQAFYKVGVDHGFFIK